MSTLSHKFLAELVAEHRGWAMRLNPNDCTNLVKGVTWSILGMPVVPDSSVPVSQVLLVSRDGDYKVYEQTAIDELDEAVSG